MDVIDTPDTLIYEGTYNKIYVGMEVGKIWLEGMAPPCISASVCCLPIVNKEICMPHIA